MLLLITWKPFSAKSAEILFPLAYASKTRELTCSPLSCISGTLSCSKEFQHQERLLSLCLAKKADLFSSKSAEASTMISLWKRCRSVEHMPFWRSMAEERFNCQTIDQSSEHTSVSEEAFAISRTSPWVVIALSTTSNWVTLFDKQVIVSRYAF